jgi:hypothetical protein
MAVATNIKAVSPVFIFCPPNSFLVISHTEDALTLFGMHNIEQKECQRRKVYRNMLVLNDLFKFQDYACHGMSYIIVFSHK